jgi:hypothetical protein
MMKKLKELKNSELSRRKYNWLGEIIDLIVIIGCEMNVDHFIILNEYASKFKAGSFSKWINATVMSFKRDIMEYKRREGATSEDTHCKLKAEGYVSVDCGYNSDLYEYFGYDGEYDDNDNYFEEDFM